MTLPATMNAVLLTGHGGLDKLVYSEVPRPEPRDGEVLVKVGACGLNNTDINTRTAWYSSTVKAGVGEGGHEGFEAADGNTGTWGSGSLNFPVIQGADVAGRIVAVGDGVSEARVGERVMIDPWLLGHGDWRTPDNSGYFGSETNGGYAEYAAVRAANAIPVNSDLNDRELATFPCAYTTAENMVQRTAPRPGETVVITGASGGVGTAAIQLCRLRGCKIIAVASRAKADALRELGAEIVIDRNEADLEAAIREAADGPMDIALDVVGASVFMPLINALRQGGRYSSSGCIGGQMTEIDLRQLIYKDLQLTGATICPPGTMHRVVEMIETGMIVPLLAEVYPLQDLSAAQQAFMNKNHIGKIVVTPVRTSAVKITRITVYKLDMPLTEPYWLSGGRLKFERLDSTFVKVDTDAGLSGWGEGCPWGHTYLPAHGPGIRAGIETLAPFLIGEDPRIHRSYKPDHGHAASGSSVCQISDRHRLLGYRRPGRRHAAVENAGRRAPPQR